MGPHVAPKSAALLRVTRGGARGGCSLCVVLTDSVVFRICPGTHVPGSGLSPSGL